MIADDVRRVIDRYIVQFGHKPNKIYLPRDQFETLRDEMNGPYARRGAAWDDVQFMTHLGAVDIEVGRVR